MSNLQGWNASDVIAWLHCTPHIGSYQKVSAVDMEKASEWLVEAFDFACDMENAVDMGQYPQYHLNNSTEMQENFGFGEASKVYVHFRDKHKTAVTSPWLGLYLYLDFYRKEFEPHKMPGSPVIEWLLSCHTKLLLDAWDFFSFQRQLLLVQNPDATLRKYMLQGFVVDRPGVLSYFPKDTQDLVGSLLVDRFLQVFEQSVDVSLSRDATDWRNILLELLREKKLLLPPDLSEFSQRQWELQDLIVRCCTRGAEQLYERGSPAWRDGLLSFLRKKELLTPKEVTPFQGKSLDPQALVVACGEHQLQKLYKTQVPRWEFQVVDFLQKKAFLTEDEAEAFSRKFDAQKIALACVENEIKKTFLPHRGLYVAGAVATYLGVTAADLAVRKGLEGCAHWIWRSAHF
jgi:hypothetical protein